MKVKLIVASAVMTSIVLLTIVTPAFGQGQTAESVSSLAERYANLVRHVFPLVAASSEPPVPSSKEPKKEPPLPPSRFADKITPSAKPARKLSRIIGDCGYLERGVRYYYAPFHGGSGIYDVVSDSNPYLTPADEVIVTATYIDGNIRMYHFALADGSPRGWVNGDDLIFVPPAKMKDDPKNSSPSPFPPPSNDSGTRAGENPAAGNPAAAPR